MKFICPHCGKGSFTIASGVKGYQFATCNNCGKTTPFKKELMTESKMTPDRDRVLHLK
jgi:transcription elongation factor Elf1